MSKWTVEQQKVIDTRNRNILVSAAAGSGKTAVLVERIIKRITDKKNPLDIDKLLVVTFTNAAAAEMRERILKAIENELSNEPDNAHLQRQQAFIHNADITTIHSFCLGLVKEHFNDVDLDPSVKVADDGEMALLRSDVVKEVLEEYYEEGSREFHDFVTQFESKNSDVYLENMILALYNKSMGYPWPNEWLDNCIAEYGCESSDDIKKSEFVKLINTYAEGILQEMVKQYDLMLYLCSNGGPMVYYDILERERTEILKIIEEKDYDRRKVKLNYKFDKLPGCKAGTCEIELKDIVSANRKNVKENFAKLNEKLYFQTSEEALGEMKKCRPIIEMYVRLTKSFISKFKEKKLDRNVIDFNDFEHYAIDILVKKDGNKHVLTTVADELAENFEEVMIDEYQDSNIVQETILSAVSKDRKGIPNRFMVGDVKQSIYGFRGANPGIFIEKYNRYDRGEDSKDYKIVLDKNFRSREGVITSTNFFFNQIMSEELGGINYDEENRLNFGAIFKECENEEYKSRIDDKTELLLINSESDMPADEIESTDEASCSDEDGSDAQDDMGGNVRELEAKAIAAKIKELVNFETGMTVYDKESDKYRPAKYSDIVILLRSINGVGDVINEELMRSGIPCHMESKSGYFSTLEIRTILSYLKIIDNPIQDIPLASVLKSPILGINDEELSLIRIAGGKDKSLYENICDYINESMNDEESIAKSNKVLEYNHDLQKRLKKFNDTLGEFRIKITYMSIYDLLCEMLDKTGYYNFIKAMPSGDRRKANVDMLKERAAAYENGSYKGLFNFIRYMEKMNKYEIDMGEASILSETDDAVRIMTVHKSKGLEFPIVFVANMEKKFNVMDTRKKSAIHFEMGIGMDYIDDSTRIKQNNIFKAAINRKIQLDGIEEEMRLFYVACTRAREKLILTAGGINDKKLEKMASKRMYDKQYMGYGFMAQCSSFLDFVVYGLGRNKAFANIYEDYLPYDMPRDNKQFNADSNVEIKYIDVMDIFADVIKEKVNEKTNVQALINLPTEKVFAEDIKKGLENRINYEYPFEKETAGNAKMSVSEIKKISYEIEQADGDETVMAEDFIKSLDEIAEEKTLTVPEFLRKGEKINGAARGTAYHTVFEFFDFEMEPTKDSIRIMIDRIKAAGRLSEAEEKSINVDDIVAFANSSLGQRMKEAYRRGELYREAQFVIGISESMVEEFKRIAEKAGRDKEFLKPEKVENSGDTILIQGIIDVYFIENGKVIIADYKTDRVKKMQELAEHYYVQLELYKLAVEQITGMKVEEKILYSVELSDEINS